MNDVLKEKWLYRFVNENVALRKNVTKLKFMMWVTSVSEARRSLLLIALNIGGFCFGKSFVVRIYL